MENLTPLEHLFLQLLAKLDDQQRQDVLRIIGGVCADIVVRW